MARLWVKAWVGLAIALPCWAVGSALPLEAREPCNRDRNLERNLNGNPDAYRYTCRHDLENNDDQFNEYYTYRAAYIDGKRWQHQDQFRQGNNVVRYYYGQVSEDGRSWQWEMSERFETGDRNKEGEIKMRQYAQRSPNGAWQNEYQWRVRPGAPLNRCYAQSLLTPNAGQREPLHDCTINNVRVGGEKAPIQMRNPKFRSHQDW